MVGFVGKTDLNWRSSLTSKDFNGLLEKHGFTTIRQFNAWGDDGEHSVAAGDLISVFQK